MVDDLYWLLGTPAFLRPSALLYRRGLEAVLKAQEAERWASYGVACRARDRRVMELRLQGLVKKRKKMSIDRWEIGELREKLAHTARFLDVALAKWTEAELASDAGKTLQNLAIFRGWAHARLTRATTATGGA